MKQANIILVLFLRIFFFREYMIKRLIDLDPGLEEVTFARHVPIFGEKRLSRRALVFIGMKMNSGNKEFFEIVVIDWLFEIEYALSPYRKYEEYKKGEDGAVKLIRYSNVLAIEFYGAKYGLKRVEKRRA